MSHYLKKLHYFSKITRWSKVSPQIPFSVVQLPSPPVDGVQVLRHSWAEWGGVTKDICLKTQQNRPYKGLNLALSILTPEC